jgi:hypothetical protein
VTVYTQCSFLSLLTEYLKEYSPYQAMGKA